MNGFRQLKFLPVASFLLLGACASRFHMDADGLRIDVKDAEIQHAIDKAGGFPFQRGLSPLGKVKVAEAKLLLIPAENAVGISVPVDVSVIGKSWSGRIAFSAAPAYEKETGIIYLHDFALREIQVPGLSKEMGEAVATIVTEVLQHTVKRYDIHQLDSNQLGEWMVKLVLKDIQVRQDAVAVHLGL